MQSQVTPFIFRAKCRQVKTASLARPLHEPLNEPRSSLRSLSSSSLRLRRSTCGKRSVGLVVLLISVHCSLFTVHCSLFVIILRVVRRVTPLLKYYLHELAILVFVSRSAKSSSNTLSVGELCSFRLAVGMTSVKVVEE